MLVCLSNSLYRRLSSQGQSAAESCSQVIRFHPFEVNQYKKSNKINK